MVDVHAVALNAADIKVATGAFGGRFIHGRAAPYVVGYDFSGAVAAGGGGFAAGDRVYGFLPYSSRTRNGSLAEQVAVSASTLGRTPATVSHVDAAAAATVGVTALQVLRDIARIGAGARVLVHGASGGAGSFLVAIGKLLGAEVTGTASAAKMDFVRAQGADAVIDYRATRISDVPGGFDAVVDAAGATSYLEARGLLGDNGTFVSLLPSFGFIVGKLATLFSSRRCESLIVRPVPADLEQVAAWLADGRLTSPIAATYAFADAAAAIAHMATGRAAGKLVVRVRD